MDTDDPLAFYYGRCHLAVRCVLKVSWPHKSSSLKVGWALGTLTMFLLGVFATFTIKPTDEEGRLARNLEQPNGTFKHKSLAF